MHIVGIPHETSKDFIENFLRDKIPNAEDIRVPIDKSRGTTLGQALVQLSPGVNVKDVLKQVKGLQMGVRKLTIAEISKGFGDSNYSGDELRGGKSGGAGFNGVNCGGDGDSGGVGATLYVGGLPDNITEQHIKNFLRDNISNAVNVGVPFNRDENKIKGMAFVQLSPGVNIQDVLSQVDGLEIGGRMLRIKESQPREGAKPYGGFGGFRGGHSGFPVGQFAVRYHWQSENVEVEILSSHYNPEYRGKICVIKTASSKTCSVWIISTDQTISISREYLKPIKPKRNDKVV